MGGCQSLVLATCVYGIINQKFSACVLAVIVKASSGPRYVVGCRNKVDKTKLTSGTRVALDMTTLTIMRALPREVRLKMLLQRKVDTANQVADV